MDLVEYYTKLTLHIKDNYDGELYKKYKKLLRVYPVAMKMVISYSQEKSDYFNANLKKLDASENRIKYEGKYSRVFGLYIENNYLSIKPEEFIKDDGRSENNDKDNKYFKNLLNKLKLKIVEIISKSMQTNKVSFYVDANENKKSSNLIDIFDDSYINSDDLYVKLLYQGAAIKTSESYDTLELEESLENETNIWSNYYKNSYTYIRITNNDLVPVGVIKILHSDKKKHLSEHLEVSKNILKFQLYISDYLKKYSLTSQLRYKAQEIQYEVYKNILGNLKHTNISLRKLLNNRLDNFTKEEIYDYTLAANYKNLINILELKDNDHNRLQLAQIIDDTFISNVIKYYDVYQKFQNKNFYELDMQIISSIKDNFTFKLTEVILRSIIFELIDNAFAHKISNIINDANRIVYNVKTHLLTHEDTFYILNEGTDDSTQKDISKYDKIFNFGYSTKNTGYGLYFIKQILNKNKIDISYAKDLPEKITKGKNITFALQIKEKR